MHPIALRATLTVDPSSPNPFVTGPERCSTSMAIRHGFWRLWCRSRFSRSTSSIRRGRPFLFPRRMTSPAITHNWRAAKTIHAPGGCIAHCDDLNYAMAVPEDDRATRDGTLPCRDTKAPVPEDRRVELHGYNARRARLPRAVQNVCWENVGLAVAVLIVVALWSGVIVLWWFALR